jgi:hypothetical protein
MLTVSYSILWFTNDYFNCILTYILINLFYNNNLVLGFIYVLREKERNREMIRNFKMIFDLKKKEEIMN